VRAAGATAHQMREAIEKTDELMSRGWLERLWLRWIWLALTILLVLLAVYAICDEALRLPTEPALLERWWGWR
jgi:hypothetical protein